MKVLGLDTATSGCSVALWEDGRVLARRSVAMTHGQAEALVPMATAVLDDAGIPYAALDRIGVTVGPGAFTGLRIALAAARGFALALNVPAVGVTTFEAIAHALPTAERAGRMLLVAVDSRRAEPFIQRFDGALAPTGVAAMPLPAAVPGLLPPGPLLVAGDGAPLLAAALAGRPDTVFAAGPGRPDAAVVAALAAGRAPGPPPEPFYLRPPDVTVKPPPAATATA